MAFIAERDAGQEANRFSLLLLEFGEVYFEDFAVNFLPPGLPDAEALARARPGRLRVCSRSVIFEPKELHFPLVKLMYRKCKQISRWMPPLMSKIHTELLSIVVDEFVETRADNLITPYNVSKCNGAEFRFSPSYVPISALLAHIVPIFKAWSLPPAQRAEKLQAITEQDHQRIEFNTCWLEDLSERIVLKVDANHITPLVSNPSRIVLTSKRIYVQPLNNVDPEPVKKYHLRDVTRIVKRRFLLRQTGIELFIANTSGLFLSFDSTFARDNFHDKLIEQEQVHIDQPDNVNMMLNWQHGNISNFDYLMYLNSMADRSFNDLTQYPVFPWLIADYESKELDLNNPKTFRDLSKPVGALNEERLRTYLERYDEMNQPKFLYGTHYSTPGFVLYFTVRAAPEYALCLHDGRFDHADRMFSSVRETWKQVTSTAADVKELIPEFYLPGGQFLTNSLFLDFGFRQDGSKVGDVELPPWASSADDFTRKCRQALECQYVSEHIHEWIDLIFGYKQRGIEAVKANNVFHHLTYEGGVDLDAITDRNQREAIELQILEFGQTPKQLFTLPHPARGSSSASSQNQSQLPSSPLLVRSMRSISISQTPQRDLSVAVSEPAVAWKTIGYKHVSTQKLHRDAITDIQLSHDEKTIFSVSQDKSLKLTRVSDYQQIHSAVIADLALSSIAVFENDTTVLIASWDNSIYIYSVDFGRVLETWMGHDDAVSKVLIRNQNTVISSSWDSSIKIWQCETDASSSQLMFPENLIGEISHDSQLTCLTVFDAKGLAISGTKDGSVNIVNLDTQSCVHRFDVHNGEVCAVSFADDGRRFASTGEDAVVKLFDVDLKQEVSSISTPEIIRCLRFHGQTIIAGGNSGTLYLFDAITSNILASYPKIHSGAIRCLALSKDGKTLFTGSDDRCLAAWVLED